MRNFIGFSLVALILVGVGVTIGIEIEGIAGGTELATCLDDVALEKRRNDQLLSGGRFLCKMEKDGNCSYRFYTKGTRK